MKLFKNIFKSKQKTKQDCDFYANDLSYHNQYCNCEVDDCIKLRKRFNIDNNTHIKQFRNVQICIDEDTNREFESWSKRGWKIVNISNPLIYKDSDNLMYYLVLFSKKVKK